jgi:hypothetical protein
MRSRPFKTSAVETLVQMAMMATAAQMKSMEESCGQSSRLLACPRIAKAPIRLADPTPMAQMELPVLKP